MGFARTADLAAADRELAKLIELRATLEKANQSYWAEQVEIQMLATSAWIAHAKGQKEEALKFMRAAADLEDNSAKHVAMENRLYPMRELLGDLLLLQQQPSQALTEYETSLLSTPNRLRGLYGAGPRPVAKSGRVLTLNKAQDPNRGSSAFRANNATNYSRAVITRVKTPSSSMCQSPMIIFIAGKTSWLLLRRSA